VSEGLTTTFRLLSETENEAAIWVLIPALDSPNVSIREEALAAILKRRSPAGHREILRRLHLADERAKDIIGRHHLHMTQAMREAILGNDSQLCVNACTAAVWSYHYDVIPALLNVLENRDNPNAPAAAKTLMQLVELLYAEMAGPPQAVRHRNVSLIRNRVIGDLEQSVGRYGKHRRREILDAFLLLVHRDNATLKQILMDPHHAAFVPVVEALSKSPSGGVIRLLLSFLDDVHAPSVTLVTFAKRTDARFVEHLLHAIGTEPSLVVKQNLKRITSINWLHNQLAMLDDVDDLAQQGAVKLVMNSGIPRKVAFAVVNHLLRYGKVGGRRAAAEALQAFGGAEANGLALEALQDEDPLVQAHILRQLRSRGIPGALPQLVAMIDSPHAVVREAVSESLAEFSFKRFLAAFDMLDDEVRLSTGLLVKKIDPQTIPLLEAELVAQVRSRRMRGLLIAQALDAVPQVEASVVRLLYDEDHLVRAQAAEALAQATSPASLDVLQETALRDHNSLVQAAARKSLNQRAELAAWVTTPSSESDEEGVR
jgi:HEAT repeat protein